MDFFTDLSTENIRAQSPKDPFITKLIEISGRLLNIANEEDKKVADSKYKKKKDPSIFRRTFNELENEIENRFGFRCSVEQVHGSFACVLIIPPKGFNVLARTEVDYAREYMANQNKGMFKGVKDTLIELDKALYFKGLKIDFAKAKVSGLPKGVVLGKIMLDCFDLAGYLFGNGFKASESDSKLTDKEVAAIILHEIGHVFTWLCNSYRVFTNCSIVMDTYIDAVEKKNLSESDAILLCYDKVKARNKTDTAFDIFLSDRKTTSLNEANIMELIGSLIENGETHNANSNHNSIHDSEALADNFASMFGLGGHLVSALRKANPNHIFYENDAWITRQLKVILGTGLGRLLCPFAVTHFILCVLVFNIIFPAWLYAGYKIFWVGESYRDKDDPYDEERRRFERARFATIKMIKQGVFTDEETQCILDNIEITDRILKLTPKESVGMIEGIWRLMHRKEVNIIELERALENLLHNDLYVAKAKFSQGYYTKEK